MKIVKFKQIIKKFNFIIRVCRFFLKIKRSVMIYRFVPTFYCQRRYRIIINKKKETYNKYFDISNYPIVIGAIKVNKDCDLNCIICNTKLSTRKNENMDLNLFEKICLYLNKIKQNLIPLHTIGEPLINPYLEDYFKILRRYKIGVVLSTNGQLLDKKLDLLCYYSNVIDTIRFSIDGASKETYEKIRSPGKFNKLVNNLNLFKEVNGNNRFFRNVKIDSIVSTDVKNELAYHLQFYSQYTKMYNIGLHLFNGLSLDDSYFFDYSVLKKYIVINRPCAQLFGSMYILCDGRVTACCRDYNSDLVFGSILENTPEELINNEKIIQLREYHINNQIPEGYLCSKCYQIDPKVDFLFETFVKALIFKNMHKWDVQKMQIRFDRFFELFDNKIPAETEYLCLLK